MKKVIYPATARKMMDTASRLVEVRRISDTHSEYLTGAARPGWFTILWLKSGCLDLSVDHQHWRLNADRLCCIAPGRDIRTSPLKGSEIYALRFSADYLLLLGQQVYQPFSLLFAQNRHSGSKTILEAPLAAELSSILYFALKDPMSGGDISTESLRGVVQILAVHFSRKYHAYPLAEIPETTDQDLFGSFVRLLDKQYVSKKSVTDYARALDVTPGRLGDAVRRASGKSASFYIRQRIVEEAKRLVLGSASSMKQVAYQVGFMDIAHFSKFFRNQTGMNFTDYKKLWA